LPLVVAPDCRETERHQPVRCFARVKRTGKNIAKIDDQVHIDRISANTASSAARLPWISDSAAIFIAAKNDEWWLNCRQLEASAEWPKVADSASSTNGPEADIREDRDELANVHSGRTADRTSKHLSERCQDGCASWTLLQR